jgi:hypothetical protein
LTSPNAWLQASEAAAASASGSGSGSPGAADPLLSAAQPCSYRELYPELLRYGELIGMWTGVGAGPRGALYRCAWAADGVVVQQVAPVRSFSAQPPVTTLFELGPCFPRLTFSVIEGSGNAARRCIIREQRAAVRRGSSAAAEAAAAVAAGGGHASPSAAPMGSSPPSSFGFQLLQFMQGNVAPSRSSSRTRSRLSGGGSGSAPPPLLHHFQHLPLPQPRAIHPLAGLWTARYGPHGLEVLLVEYDFSGSSAVIKVGGGLHACMHVRAHACMCCCHAAMLLKQAHQADLRIQSPCPPPNHPPGHQGPGRPQRAGRPDVVGLLGGAHRAALAGGGGEASRGGWRRRLGFTNMLAPAYYHHTSTKKSYACAPFPFNPLSSATGSTAAGGLPA